MKEKAPKIRLRGTAATILTIIGGIGVVATAVAAVKATPRAVDIIRADSRVNHDGDPYGYTKKEAIVSAWKCYIPAAAIGLTTIMCIFGANVFNKRQQASLTSAYALISSTYQEYKDKVRELYGEEAHEKVMTEIAKEKVKDVKLTAGTLIGDCCLDFVEDDDEPKRLFYDSFSDKYFESTINKVIQAEYHLNRNFSIGGYVTLNDFYEFLGLEETDLGDTIGWSIDCITDDLNWIDFDHYKTVLDDGLECYVIDMMYHPTAESLIGWK